MPRATSAPWADGGGISFARPRGPVAPFFSGPFITSDKAEAYREGYAAGGSLSAAALRFSRSVVRGG